MQHDKDNPEDMDTDGDDHGVDDTRYACLSRPWARPTPPKKEERTPAPAITLNELVRATAQRRRNSYLCESDPAGRPMCGEETSRPI